MSSLDFTYKNIDKVIDRSNMIVDKIDPKKSLLLVLDMQHACVTKGGAMYIPSIGGAPEGADVVQPVLNVLNACRKVGIPVVWSMWGLREDGKDAGYAEKKWGVDLMNFPGSWGHGGDELDSHLVPLPGEPIMKKHRFSSFYGTALNEYMKHAGADTLIIAGVSTANCMLTTAIDGANQDIKVICLADTSAAIPASLENQPDGYGQHWEALRNIQANHGDVRLSTEILLQLA
jgi:ureidoacrylate peracid hydrolase